MLFLELLLRWKCFTILSELERSNYSAQVISHHMLKGFSPVQTIRSLNTLAVFASGIEHFSLVGTWKVQFLRRIQFTLSYFFQFFSHDLVVNNVFISSSHVWLDAYVMCIMCIHDIKSEKTLTFVNSHTVLILYRAFYMFYGIFQIYVLQAKRLVVYLVRANKEATIQTLMTELQVGSVTRKDISPVNILSHYSFPTLYYSYIFITISYYYFNCSGRFPVVLSK